MFTTFLINLDKDTERLNYMDKQLSKLNISYRRQPAFFGKLYIPRSQEYDENLAIKKGGRALLPGEIGCALSHSLVLNNIVQEKIPYTLVLEDDVELPSNFKEIIEIEINKHQNQPLWDYLLFDYVEVGLPFIKQWIGGVKENFRNLYKQSLLKSIMVLIYAFVKGFYIIPLSIFESFRNWYRHKNPGAVIFYRPVYFAGAYLISLKGAEKLLPLTKPIVYTADQLPNRARVLCGLNYRCYAPLSVRQLKRKFGSSILDLEGKDI